MLTRRELLQGTATSGAVATVGYAFSQLSAATAIQESPNSSNNSQEVPPGIGGVVLNDKQSQLNATRVRKVERLTSLDDIVMQITAANRNNLAISVAGGRHAMGGQQFGTDTLHLDTTSLTDVLEFDAQSGLIRVQAGIDWIQLLDFLHTHQRASSKVWSIRQKQTGVDHVTLAGTLSANAHGRGLQFPPFADDVESLVVVDAAGTPQRCSRTENSELFSLVLGGYGLFGVVAEVTLRLVPRVKVKRTVEVIEVKDVINRVAARIEEGYQFGDCQYSTDFSDLDQPHRAVFSCYKPVEDVVETSDATRKLSEKDWTDLLFLGHVDKRRAFDIYSEHYLRTDGQVYWSDTHQLSNNFDDYHLQLDRQLNASHKGSEIITELYVKRERLLDFLRAARKAVHDHKIELIYGTIRFIEKDEVSFLAWAKEQSVCVLCNLHVEHTPAGIAKVADHARKLIQIALDHGGRYFPTYHRWANREQVLQAYPQFVDFLKLKKKYDPQERFQSEWYRHYRAMFRDQLS